MSAEKLTVKLYGKGVVAKVERGTGSENTKYFRRRVGQLIYSRLDFLNGAFGLIPGELDGRESTADLPAFDILDTADARWLLAYVTQPTFYERQRSSAIGSRKARRVAPSEFLRMEVPVPPLPEQKKIAAILSSVDEAIRATQAVIDQTRRVKEGLLQELLTRGIGPDGKPHTRFKQTEIGAVPEGWEVRKLATLAKIKSGGTPSRGEPSFWGGAIPWVTTGQIDYGQIVEPSEYITEAGLSSSAATLFPSGTIVMAMYGQGTTRGRVARLAIEATTNQACAAFLDLRGVQADYLFQFFVHSYRALRSLSQEGTQKNLSAALLKEVWVPVPPIAEQRMIADCAGNLDRVEAENGVALSSLVRLKSSLLTSLLTGQVRVNP